MGIVMRPAHDDRGFRVENVDFNVLCPRCMDVYARTLPGPGVVSFSHGADQDGDHGD